jgi:diguanylate cyclase
LRRFPGFSEIELEHERMHRFARTLLLASAKRVPISMRDYEHFLSALKRMRLEVEAIKHDLDDALRNLDPLTGAPGRVGMLAALRSQLEMVKRKMHSCCMIMLDIDNFKVVNDTYGHLIGDQVLIAISHYIMAHLRPYDLFFRYGGEEFLFCVVDVDLQTSRDIVERLCKELASLVHRGSGQEQFHVTVSCGLAVLDADVPVEQSIDRADRALYAAKSTGRNRTVVWDASMTGNDGSGATPPITGPE